MALGCHSPAWSGLPASDSAHWSLLPGPSHGRGGPTGGLRAQAASCESCHPLELASGKLLTFSVSAASSAKKRGHKQFLYQRLLGRLQGDASGAKHLEQHRGLPHGTYISNSALKCVGDTTRSGREVPDFSGGAQKSPCFLSQLYSLKSPSLPEMLFFLVCLYPRWKASSRRACLAPVRAGRQADSRYVLNEQMCKGGTATQSADLACTGAQGKPGAARRGPAPGARAQLEQGPLLPSNGLLCGGAQSTDWSHQRGPEF